jgi:hypothetical protein
MGLCRRVGCQNERTRTKVHDLIDMYRRGAITAYQVMMDSLQMLDPDHPDLVLSHLPEEILEELSSYARRYDPSSIRSIAGPPPAVDQVRAAQRWIEGKKRHRAEQPMASSSE